MDCDVEEVPSTESELTGSTDSASTCSSTLSSISNTSWTPTAKKPQNGARTPKSFVWTYFTKNRSNTHAVCTPSKCELKLNKTGATSHLISHIRNCHTEVRNEKDKGQGDISDITIPLRRIAMNVSQRHWLGFLLVKTSLF